MLDAANNTPLDGVQILVREGGSARILTSDGAGGFLIDGILSAQLNAEFRRDGYRTSRFSLAATPGASLDIGQVRLSPESAGSLLPDLAATALDSAALVYEPRAPSVAGDLSVVIENLGPTAVGQAFELIAFFDADSDGLPSA